MMEKKSSPEKTETKLLNIVLPEELMARVKTFCADKDMTIQEFVTDTTFEKLDLVYKERRKKNRL